MKIQRQQLYKCQRCGNIVHVLNGGGPVPECCHQTMWFLEENTVDAATEKHVPVVQKVQGGFKVKVGDVAHPMEADHYIQLVELIADGVSYIKFFSPGDAPEADFKTDAEDATVRAYCNLHGLWKS